MNSFENQYNPSISIDCVIFGIDSKKLKILLVERLDVDSAIPRLKLPGSLVLKDRKLEEYALQVLKELTGLENIYLKQYHTFGDPDRIKNPEDKKWIETTYQIKTERIVSIAYYSLIKIDSNNQLISNNNFKATWCDVSEIKELAFDHLEIMNTGLKTLRMELNYNPSICFEFLPEKFSLRQLQDIYEAIQGIKYDNRNFRKKVHKAKHIVKLNEKQKGVAHKPASLYFFNKEEYMRNSKELIKFLI